MNRTISALVFALTIGGWAICLAPMYVHGPVVAAWVRSHAVALAFTVSDEWFVGACLVWSACAGLCGAADHVRAARCSDRRERE